MKCMVNNTEELYTGVNSANCIIRVLNHVADFDDTDLKYEIISCSTRESKDSFHQLFVCAPFLQYIIFPCLFRLHLSSVPVYSNAECSFSGEKKKESYRDREKETERGRERERERQRERQRCV